MFDPGDPSKVGASTLVRFNAAESHVLGLDFDGGYRLPFGFMVGLRGQVLDARFDEGHITDSRLGLRHQQRARRRRQGASLPRAPWLTRRPIRWAQNISTPLG